MEQHPYQDAGELRAPRRPIPEWLDDESIEEFRKIYEQEFGEKLTEGEARIVASRLLELYYLLISREHDDEDRKG